MAPSRDKLTGFYTPDAFARILQAEVERSSVCEHPLVLVLCEVQYAAEQRHYAMRWALHYSVLRQIAPLLGEGLRRVDSAARLDGDGLGILLPETPGQGGRIVAERMRQRVDAGVFSGDEAHPRLRVALNLGLAFFPVHGKSGRELTAAAHKAMLIARQEGGNRVVVFPEQLHQDFPPRALQ